MTRVTAVIDTAPDTTLPQAFVNGQSLRQPEKFATLPVRAADDGIFKPLVLLSLPILIENLLHMLVGLTDVYLAGHLPENAAAATAAVGTVAYILWFVNLIAMSIATGATAIVSRAIGAKHRSLANSIAGQSVMASLLVGTFAAMMFALMSGKLADLTELKGEAHDYARYYFQILSISLPFSLVTVAAGAVLRGAGDTVSPAIAMVIVDLVNIGLSLVLTRGYFGLPEMGFKGIAIGTVVAYVVGGMLLVGWLARGKRVRLHRHRLLPHWSTMRRLIRIGLPNGVEGGLTWGANFVILRTINDFDASNISGAAHIVTIRVESFSFSIGLAIATATATLVGQSLGQKNPARAARVTYAAAALGIGAMICWAVVFLTSGRQLAWLMTSDPAAIDLAARCLFITAFSQIGFAATLVFSGALRGAGDTFAVMLINIISQLGLRLVGVLVLVKGFHFGLEAVWVVLAVELTVRGALIAGRFLHGGWKHVKV